MARQGFVSWAHNDHKLLEDIWPHVIVLGRAHKIEFWIDKDNLRGGDIWDDRIGVALIAAECHLIMISVNSLRSDYIWNREWPLIARQRRKGKLVIPILLSDCLWTFAFGGLQALPIAEDARTRAVDDWSPRRKGVVAAFNQADRACTVHFDTLVSPDVPWGAE